MINIDLLIKISTLVCILLFIYLVIEGIRTLMSFRKVINRVELVTDLKGWLSFFRKK